MLDLERGSSQSQFCTSHLTEPQQKALEPRFWRLAACFKFGAACCCCTACLSFLPYWLYRRRVLRHVRDLEDANEGRAGDGDIALSVDKGPSPDEGAGAGVV